MKWYDFVFSDHRKERLLRHTVFWAAWWLYFFTVYWYTQHVAGVYYDNFIKLGSHIFLKSFLLLSIHAIACYAFIYVLLPRYLVKSSWLKLVAISLLVCMLVVTTGYVIHAWLFPLVNSVF